MRIHTNYLQGLGDPRIINRIVKNAIKRLRGKGLVDKFDTIVYTGLSGALIAIPLAMQLHKKLCAVRKEGSHSNEELEGVLGPNSLIIDDFIGQGNTLCRIMDKIKNKTKVCGMYCYLYAGDSKIKNRRFSKKFDFPIISTYKRSYLTTVKFWTKLAYKEKIRY